MKYTNIIPLGDNCAISIILKELNLRKKSYPFDWSSHVGPDPTYSNIEININILIELLETKNIENAINKLLNNKISENNKINDELIFPHETGTKLEINEKYIRRLNRLLDDVTNPSNNNVFILLTRCYLINENILSKLYDLLMKFNKENKIIFISGLEHSYLINKKLNNFEFKYIYYDVSKGWDYDYSDFRPKIKDYLTIVLQSVLE